MPDRSAHLPSALRAAARWFRIGPDDVPVMLAHPSWMRRSSGSTPIAAGAWRRPAESTALREPLASHEPTVPVILWMHGRTVTKETDPGRYLRWIRAGLGVCAIDLPGHGERLDASLQRTGRTLDVVLQMAGEIDGIVEGLRGLGAFDPSRMGLGGMSAGGMAALVRLGRSHPFTCASVEATSGSWQHQRRRAMFRERPADEIDRWDPVQHLDQWTDIPFQAIHSKRDEWVAFEGQQAFIEALRGRAAHPDRVELIAYDHTGAPNEHAGFGRMASDAKDRQRDFFRRWLLEHRSGADSSRRG